MRKLYLTLILVMTPSLCAHAGSVNLSTYYPAPFGAYDRLRLVPRDFAGLPDPCPGMEGTLYYDEDLHRIQLCREDATWGSITGIWTFDSSTDAIYPSDTATNPNLIVGIGTTVPESILHLSAPSPSLYIKGSSGADYSSTIRLAGENADNWRGGYIQYDAAGERLVIGVHDTADKLIANDTRVMVMNRSTGNIGIAMYPTASYKLDVNGTIHANGADLAENFPVEEGIEPGDVVVIGEAGSNKLKKSDRPYDEKIAGVISTDPGFSLGAASGPEYQPLALTGQVPCKVTTENGPIQKGDLLASSSKPGYAMKASFIPLDDIESLSELKTAIEENQKRQLSIIGKALESFDESEGTVVILMAR